jgi:hypothetical protein
MKGNVITLYKVKTGDKVIYDYPQPWENAGDLKRKYVGAKVSYIGDVTFASEKRIAERIAIFEAENVKVEVAVGPRFLLRVK